MTKSQSRAAGLTAADIAALKLNKGAHDSPDRGHCLLEVVSMLAGEPFSDQPRCVDYVLAEFGRKWNDSMRSDEERDQLKCYIPLLVDTAHGETISQRRAWMCVDWIIRVNTATWLELSPATAEHAVTLRSLAPINGETELAIAQPILYQARIDAKSTRTAAWISTRDAVAASDDTRYDACTNSMFSAWSVVANMSDATLKFAFSAVTMAKLDDTQYGALNDAREAATSAATAATFTAVADTRAIAWEDIDPQFVYETVSAFLEPTRKRLQEEAHALYLRMINERIARRQRSI